jgi:hypothetical protein
VCLDERKSGLSFAYLSVQLLRNLSDNSDAFWSIGCNVQQCTQIYVGTSSSSSPFSSSHGMRIEATLIHYHSHHYPTTPAHLTMRSHSAARHVRQCLETKLKAGPILVSNTSNAAFYLAESSKPDNGRFQACWIQGKSSIAPQPLSNTFMPRYIVFFCRGHNRRRRCVWKSCTELKRSPRNETGDMRWHYENWHKGNG